MKQARYRTAAVCLSILTLSSGGDALGAPAEDGQNRCPFQQTTLRMDVSVEDVTLDYRGDELRIAVGESNEGMNMRRFDRRSPYLELAHFEFSDRSLCTADLIDRGFDLVGTEESEIVLGTNATDRIRGKQGNDTLDGAEGDDTYFYDSGDGLDCIQDFSGQTTISFGEGILPQDLLIADDNSQDRTLFLRIAPKNGAEASQGLNIRTNSQTTSSLDFWFADGSTLALPELQRVADRERLDAQVLVLQQACYFEVAAAARAGLPNKRAASAPFPPEPKPLVVPEPNPHSIMYPGSDGKVHEITQQCISSASGERKCY